MSPSLAYQMLGYRKPEPRDAKPERRRPHCTAKDPIDPAMLRPRA